MRSMFFNFFGALLFGACGVACGYGGYLATQRAGDPGASDLTPLFCMIGAAVCGFVCAVFLSSAAGDNPIATIYREEDHEEEG